MPSSPDSPLFSGFFRDKSGRRARAISTGITNRPAKSRQEKMNFYYWPSPTAYGSRDQEIALTRAVRRETVREAVLR